MTGLYVHIPFCEKKCHYCNFVITTEAEDSKSDLFFDCLEKEIHERSAYFKEKAFDTLYIGGGTPSQLSVPQTERLFRLLHLNFELMENAEITWEANPSDITAEKAKLYKNLEINRVSLGAQSFNDKILKSMNRTHEAADIYRSFEFLRKAGISNINMDLMLALPKQYREDIRKSLSEVKILKPSHISLYELVLEDKTVFSQWHKSGKLELPDEEQALEFLEEMRLGLGREGYVHYELLNYAKPGMESRHNQLYWMNEEYLGLGPGAYSYYDGKRFQYTSSVEDYYKKAAGGDWTNYEEETLTAEKRLRESFVLRLRLLQKGLDLREFPALSPEYKAKIAALKAQGLLHQDKGILKLSSKGRLFAETVFSELS